VQIQIALVVEGLGEDLKDTPARPSEPTAETGGGTFDTTDSDSPGRPTGAGPQDPQNAKIAADHDGMAHLCLTEQGRLVHRIEGSASWRNES
jgi:hypothetical protein